jgi:glycosyltransferase involved in cell wall biosynthesis
MKNHITKKPLVSVIMPVHNAGAFLSEAIESILNQTYENFELIIVDDASNDLSSSIIKRYKRKYPTKIYTYTLIHALGQSGDPATDFGISKAKGTYIAKMDADDVAVPERLERQVKFLQKNKDIFLVGSHAEIIDRNGKKLGIKQTPVSHKKIYTSFFLYCNVIHPSIMFRNNFSNNFYKIKFPYFNEYYTFFKLMSQGKRFANIPEPLLLYRIHGNNDTFSHTREKFKSTLRIRAAFIFECGYIPSILQIGTTLLQSIAVFALPQRIMIALYLLSKGVISIDDIFPLPILKRFTYAISYK